MKTDERLHALDTVRGFALLLGVAFHATISFIPGMPPGIWAMVDNSPSQFLADAGFVTHIFRMSLFFFIAGFFGRMLYHKLGARGFAGNRAVRIAVPLIAGWILMFPLIAWLWTVGLTKVFNGQTPAMPPMPNVAGAFPLAHLWFLYQLLLLYIAVIGARALFARLDGSGRIRALVDRAVTGILQRGAAPFVLGLPLSAALVALPFWFYFQGIPTPDMSLIPLLPAAVGYGTAFAFGWLVQRAPGALPAISRMWLSQLFIAGGATAYLLNVVHSTPMAQPGSTKLAFAVLFGVALWSWVFAITGMALRFLPGYSAVRRYIADASYWIYLAHLPVVVALQVWVGHWPLHWGVKYPLVLVASLAVLFVSYHFLVRSTMIGQLLNGRRVPRGGLKAPSPASLAESQAAGSVVALGARAATPAAQLRGVTKRYGTTTALAGIDLEVRSGELLAVLGPNGAGKSTSIALWLGLIEADAGEVMLLGGAPQDIDRRRHLGVMMQDVDLVKELRVRELIELSASYYHDPMSVEETLAMTGIATLANRLYGALSGGQKRQVQFAIAICGRPKLLFLDEPTVGLDIHAREALWSNVRALMTQGCSIVLTTHYLEEAEALATRVVVINKGQVIASGSVDEMRSLVARRQVSCETTLTVAELATWPGVASAVSQNGRLLITATDAEAVVLRLLTTDPTLRRLEVREAGLADAFTELTREAA